MAREDQKALINRLFDAGDERLLRAFMVSIQSIKDQINLSAVVAQLERGDINGAIAEMNLDADAFARFELAVVETYNDGGFGTTENLPRVTGPDGSRAVFRWGVRNLEAESWLANHSSMLVSRILDDQRVGIRAALAEGLAEGENPRQTALAVVGRVNRVTGRREGGIIGITSAQERYVANARRELLSGDPEQLRNYLTRERRDKRFDRSIERAIQTKKPIPREMVEKVLARYSDRLLSLRGEMLARTETMTALSKGRDDALRQQIQNGKLQAEDLTKIWHSTNDDRTRHTHRALNGVQLPMDGYFQSPSGSLLRFPGDPEAPASETVGCRCWLEYKIDYIGQVVRRQQLRAA